MLNFTLEEQINPSKEILELLNKTSYRANKGTIKTLSGTNLKFIKPTVYIIRKPIKLTNIKLMKLITKIIILKNIIRNIHSKK